MENKYKETQNNRKVMQDDHREKQNDCIETKQSQSCKKKIFEETQNYYKTMQNNHKETQNLYSIHPVAS